MGFSIKNLAKGVIKGAAGGPLGMVSGAATSGAITKGKKPAAGASLTSIVSSPAGKAAGTKKRRHAKRIVITEHSFKAIKSMMGHGGRGGSFPRKKRRSSW